MFTLWPYRGVVLVICYKNRKWQLNAALSRYKTRNLHFKPLICAMNATELCRTSTQKSLLECLTPANRKSAILNLVAQFDCCMFLWFSNMNKFANILARAAATWTSGLGLLQLNHTHSQSVLSGDHVSRCWWGWKAPTGSRGDWVQLCSDSTSTFCNFNLSWLSGRTALIKEKVRRRLTDMFANKLSVYVCVKGLLWVGNSNRVLIALIKMGSRKLWLFVYDFITWLTWTKIRAQLPVSRLFLLALSATPIFILRMLCGIFLK